MDIIFQQCTLCNSLIGDQNIKKNTDYRPIRFIQTLECDDGLLVYNVLTTMFVLLKGEEILFFNGKKKYIDGKLGVELIKKWFLVPEDTDDFKLCKQFSDIMLTVSYSRIGKSIKSFTILPTTDCNARCFYCFELSGSRKNMCASTAHNVADFIDRKKASNFVFLRWFGGEPLYNYEAIDIICRELQAKGIDYVSDMVTNGYLFDDELISKGKELWKLRSVQITLDGTEEIYNRIKAYIYKDTNAFERVINNIERLLKKEIEVRVRMNMDEHNEKDLFDLSEQLISRFNGYSKFLMYARLLFEDSCARISARDDDDRHKLIEKQIRLSKRIEESGHADYILFQKRPRYAHCMCDDDDSTMILPDGKLGKCQHFTEDHFYGDIYSDKIDIDVLKQLKEVMLLDKSKCPNCELLPMCISLKSCLIIPHRCDEYDKKHKQHFIDTCMKNTYKEYKGNH